MNVKDQFSEMQKILLYSIILFNTLKEIIRKNPKTFQLEIFQACNR